MTEPLDLDKEAMLDKTPLKFGMHRGKTPEWVSEQSQRHRGWLIWAYETVGNFDVCSAALYRECGGKGTRAGGTNKNSYPAKSGKSVAADQGEDGMNDRYESRGSSGAKSTGGFDDFDDDIPF